MAKKLKKETPKKVSSTLSDAVHAISVSGDQYRTTEEDWRKSLGEPFLTYEEEDFTYGFWKIGTEVMRTQIGKRGPILGYYQTFSRELIEKLVATLNS